MTILQWIQNMDAQILLFIQQYIRKDIFDGFWKTITFLGDGGWFWIALGVILLIPKKTRKAGFTALIALAIGAVFTNLGLKQLVARTRPYDAVEGLVPLVAKLKDFSFPSGHTCASFACAAVYLRLYPGIQGKGAVILAFLIALSRLYVGVHYPTDVINFHLQAASDKTLLNLYILRYNDFPIHFLHQEFLEIPAHSVRLYSYRESHK